jgi:hypothetical protein
VRPHRRQRPHGVDDAASVTAPRTTNKKPSSLLEGFFFPSPLREREGPARPSAWEGEGALNATATAVPLTRCYRTDLSPQGRGNLVAHDTPTRSPGRDPEPTRTSLTQNITGSANLKATHKSCAPSHGLTGGSNPRLHLDCPIKPGNGDKGVLGDGVPAPSNPNPYPRT